MKRTPSPHWTGVAWGIACELRRLVQTAEMARWPMDALTKRERKKLERAVGHLEAAREEIMSLQASLSERAKLAGVTRPDYEEARRVM